MILLKPRPCFLCLVGYFCLCFYFFFVCLFGGGDFPHFKQSTGFSLATSQGVGGLLKEADGGIFGRQAGC